MKYVDVNNHLRVVGSGGFWQFFMQVVTQTRKIIRSNGNEISVLFLMGWGERKKTNMNN